MVCDGITGRDIQNIAQKERTGQFWNYNKNEWKWLCSKTSEWDFLEIQGHAFLRSMHI